MDITIYKFPTIDNPHAVERAYCELLNAKRSGESLPDEVVDWMESANTWLMDTNTW